MAKLWQQVSSIWARLEVAQRATIVLALIGAVALAGVLFYAASQPSYRVLASGLTKAQVAEIVAHLDQGNVKYELADHDSSILVPSSELYRLRNELSQREMLSDGSKGFELLDKSGMFESSFREHRNYDRAVAGELERNFKEITGVETARVLIDRPQPSPFVDDVSAKPKASVKLHLRSGVRLSDRQVAGIIHLTAGAVAGLAPERVEVMDDHGRLTPDAPDSQAAHASTALEAEIAREAHLTRKAQEQLDTVLGPGRSRVKVSVRLDFTKRAESSTDPTISKALEENTQTSDEKTPFPSTGGVAGTASNVEGEARPVAQPPAIGSKTSEQTQTRFVVGKKTVTKEDEIGRTSGMNVSILLDAQVVKEPEKDKDGKPTGKILEKQVEYSDAERKRFQELVLNAIGFNAAKEIAARLEPGADIAARFTSTVQSMAFYQQPVEVVEAGALGVDWEKENVRWWLGFALSGFIGVVALWIAWSQISNSHRAVLAAELRARQAAEEEAKRNAPPPPPPESPEEEMARQLRGRRDLLKENVRKRISENPAIAAAILRSWLAEG
ncbi:flagellar M-ring protein [Planctomycetota bacterium]|nr:flagellar M-ring protein [Planctomycetota bacterium]